MKKRKYIWGETTDFSGVLTIVTKFIFTRKNKTWYWVKNSLSVSRVMSITPEVWLCRHAWSPYHSKAVKVGEVLEHLRLRRPEMGGAQLFLIVLLCLIRPERIFPDFYLHYIYYLHISKSVSERWWKLPRRDGMW